MSYIPCTGVDSRKIGMWVVIGSACFLVFNYRSHIIRASRAPCLIILNIQDGPVVYLFVYAPNLTQLFDIKTMLLTLLIGTYWLIAIILAVITA